MKELDEDIVIYSTLLDELHETAVKECDSEDMFNILEFNTVVSAISVTRELLSENTGIFKRMEGKEP